MELRERLEAVKNRMVRAANVSGRSGQAVRLVAVTKEVSVGQIEAALALGLRDIGENRVQEALVKHRAIGTRAVWHCVGHLQRNKARQAVGLFQLIHSVDSLRLAEALEASAAAEGTRQTVLLQVKTSGEPTQYGFAPSEVPSVVPELARLRHLEMQGLMTIAPFTKDRAAIRESFRGLRELRDTLAATPEGETLHELSMGMSEDFEIAIEEGATIVRLGRILFEDAVAREAADEGGASWAGGRDARAQ